MPGEERTSRLCMEVEEFFKSKGMTRFLYAFEDPDSDCYAMGKRGDLWALGAVTAIRAKLKAQQEADIHEERDL